MIDVPTIQGLYRYNTWANRRVFDAVSTLGEEEFTRDLGSSYPSVRDTLVHIVWAEWVWLQRWKGVSPKAAFDAADFPNFDAVRARWSAIESEQRSFLEAVTEAQLAAAVHYINLKGEAWQYPLWRQMCHVVNHSTYHRGQVTTMLRQLGARPVSTDLLMFDDAQTSSQV